MSPKLLLLVLMSFHLLLLLSPTAHAQKTPASQAPVGIAPLDLPSCTLQGKNYLCSKPNLQQALAATHTVAIVSQPANHASDAALASLARSLGKTTANGDAASSAQLTFRLTPVEPAGVTVGAGTVDLATLNIFVAAPGDPTARLLWSETYNGDPDLPWPAVVNALTRQFKSRLGVK